MIVYEMCYPYETVGAAGIVCVPLDYGYLEEYRKIYNDCFCEMRKALGIKPVNVYTDTRIYLTENLLLINQIKNG